MNQSHAAPDNQPTTILHRCDHLSFLLQRSPSFSRTRSIQLSTWLFLSFVFPPRHTDDTIVPLSIYIPFSLALRVQRPLSTPIRISSSVRSLDQQVPSLRPNVYPPLFINLEFSSPSLLFHYISRPLVLPRTEHRPILHLNLVNLPELANELWAWCLILAHEHGRRYTASNASGEGTRVYMCVQSAAKVEVTSPG